MTTVDSREPRSWAIGLGRNGKYWPECQAKGIIVVEGGPLTDFRNYPAKEDFAKAISQSRNNDIDPVNDALMMYQFCWEMRTGYYVMAKIGKDTGSNFTYRTVRQRRFAGAYPRRHRQEAACATAPPAGAGGD